MQVIGTTIEGKEKMDLVTGGPRKRTIEIGRGITFKEAMGGQSHQFEIRKQQGKRVRRSDENRRTTSEERRGEIKRLTVKKRRPNP